MENTFVKHLSKESIVPLNYESESLPASVRILKPVMYREGQDSFCCILGPDPQEGIFGCGETPEAALADWDSAFQQLEAKSAALEDGYAVVRQLESRWKDWKKDSA